MAYGCVDNVMEGNIVLQVLKMLLIVDASIHFKVYGEVSAKCDMHII